MSDEQDSIYLQSSLGDDLQSPEIVPPNLRLVERNEELWLEETTTGKLVKVGNRHVARLDV